LGTPSIAEYWHMGETNIRLRKVISRSFKGEKSLLTILLDFILIQ